MHSYNPAEKAALLTWQESGGTYELYKFPTDAGRKEVDCKRGAGLAACFVSRNRFAVLDATRKIAIKNLDNEVTKWCTPPYPGTTCIFYAGTGALLVRSPDKV